MTSRPLFFIVLLTIASSLLSCGDDADGNGSDDLSVSTRIEQVPDTIVSDSLPIPQPDVYGDVPGRRYGVESGMIAYWNGRVGAYDTLYFVHHGGREAFYSAETADPNDTVRRRVVALYDADTGRFVQYDALTRVGSMFDLAEERGPLLGYFPRLTDSTGAYIGPYNVRSIPPRNVLGYTAEGLSYTMDGEHRLWLWRGIPVAHEWYPTTGGGPILFEARRIDTTSTVSPTNLSIPTDVTIHVR